MATVAYLIVHHTLIHKHTSAPTPIVQTTNSSTSKGTTHRVSLSAKFYVVRPDDTLSKIAAHTGVSVSTLENLNPGVNPNALHPSQRLRLRR